MFSVLVFLDGVVNTYPIFKRYEQFISSLFMNLKLDLIRFTVRFLF